jgi:hypothetical protein
MFFLLMPLFFVIFLIIVLHAISVVMDARAQASTQQYRLPLAKMILCNLCLALLCNPCYSIMPCI